MCGAATEHAAETEPALDAPSPAALNPFTPLPAAEPPDGLHPFQFRLITLLLVTALVAIVCGALAVHPALGVGVAVLFVPSLAWTWVVRSRRAARNVSMSTTEVITFFLKTLGVNTSIVISVAVAFYGTCWVGFFGGAAVSSPFAKGYDSIGWGLGTGVVLGVAAGIALLVFLVRRIWPRGD